MREAGDVSRLQAAHLAAAALAIAARRTRQELKQVATIAIPGTPIDSFGVLTVDQATGLGYLADKDNSAVVVFDTKTDNFVSRIAGFVGLTKDGNTSGPNGLAIVNSGRTSIRRRVVGQRRRQHRQSGRPENQRDRRHDRDRREEARQRHCLRSATADRHHRQFK